MHDRIIDGLALGGRHTRSIALDRDLADDKALEGYLMTPNAIAALKQIGTSLERGDAQRAWKVVGPYGSGKSALGVLLAQLLNGKARHPEAWQLLNKATPQVAASFQRSHLYALAIVGSRMSIGQALAAAVRGAMGGWNKNKAAARVKSQFDDERGLYKGMPLNAVAGELAVDFAVAAKMQGYEGVVLLIDEVGKFVEHAALYPDQGDLIALQQIAESACDGNDEKLAVIAMLHQHFASYAAGVGRALSDEWHKIASRFEEIPFDEPVERYAHFASHALGVKPQVLRSKEVDDAAQALYGKALELGALRSASAVDKALFEQPARLYPLHPLSIAALAVVSKRYGQSERSFHAFLRGSEPLALLDFAQRCNVDAQTWYRLPDVYDYLASGYGLRFRDLGAERRWAFAVATVERHADDPLASKVLKSIAVLELVQTDIGLAVTADLIAFVLGGKKAQIEGILAQMADNGILIRRRKKSEYGFAVSDAVNIEALFERVARTNEEELVVRGISRLLSQRLIVANKHYDKGGTIRTMGVIVGAAQAWPEIPKAKGDELKPDAWLKLILLTPEEHRQAFVAAKLQSDVDPLSVAGCLVLSAEGRAALAEFSIWQDVLREVNSKRLDPWTNRYVEGRLQQANEAVGRLVTSALIPSPERGGICYWYQGEQIRDSESMNTSQIASWLFDKVYHQAPRIVNELINKDKPTSAIVLARQRLFDVLLSNDPTRPVCGATEYPPERLIHSTLLRHTGIWEETHGRWQLIEPSAEASVDITAIWVEISRLMSAEVAPTFAQVLEGLAAAPFGVRAGPAGIWVALYLLINRSRSAVFERGSLLLELSAEHFQRLFKNPQAFTLRELGNADHRKRLLTDYRVVLASIGCQFEGEPTYLELARGLYRWFARLPDFTKQTTQIGKDAALVRSMLKTAGDPIELLTKTLPAAHVQSKAKSSLVEWLTATLTDLGMAHRRLQELVANELGAGFAIAGPLSRVRNQLQEECAGSASHLADARLRGFILRCTDLSLTDEKWLDSVGSLIVQRPLDAWNDETISKFHQSLTELCGHYRRWMSVVMQRGKAPRAAERFVGLTLTLPGGQETTVFVAETDEARGIAQNVLELVAQSTQGNGELGSAVLAQALLELQARIKKSSEEESDHGQRKTS